MVIYQHFRSKRMKLTTHQRMIWEPNKLRKLSLATQHIAGQCKNGLCQNGLHADVSVQHL